MKKTILSAVIAGLVIITSGCADSAPAAPSDAKQSQEQQEVLDVSGESNMQVTFEDLVKANSRDSLLSRHKNYAVKQVIENDSQDQINAYGASSYDYYSDKDITYGCINLAGVDNAEEDIWEYCITPEGRYWRSCTDGKDDIWGLDWYFMNDDEKKTILAYNDINAGLVIDGTASGEAFVSCEDNGDGTFTLITNAPAIESSDIETLPDDWKNAVIEYQYIADKETLDLNRLIARIIVDDDAFEYINETVSYDVEGEPEEASPLLEFAKSTANDKPKNPREITVIYDPGTKNEESFSYTADKSYRVTPILRDGYTQYEDPEGKTPKLRSDGKGDVTIYAIKENE